MMGYQFFSLTAFQIIKYIIIILIQLNWSIMSWNLSNSDSLATITTLLRQKDWQLDKWSHLPIKYSAFTLILSNTRCNTR